MKVQIEGDPKQLQSVAEKVKSNPKAMEDLVADPHKFLKQFGITVDPETAKAVVEQVKKRKIPAPQGSIVHIDLAM